MRIPNLLDAIRVVKENERVASATYADAAQKIRNSWGKELFLQLSEFEQFHYEKITALETSLVEKGNYTDYEGKEFPLPPLLEMNVAEDPNKISIIEIIIPAIALEQKTEKTYASLAAKIKDPQGHKMFSKLSEEEHSHYRLLQEAYWTISNNRQWKWSRS